MYVELHSTHVILFVLLNHLAQKLKFSSELSPLLYIICVARSIVPSLKKNMHMQYLIGTNKHAFRKYVSIQKSLRYVVYIGNVVVV